MALPNYLRSGRSKWVTSGVQVTPGVTSKANKCDMYSNLLYDKTWTLKGGNCKCLKINKKRIIIPVCGNMAGSEKLPPSFVGKTKYPLYFNNTMSLPGTYHHIEAVWVIRKIAFSLWSLNRQMTSMKRTVLLFVDQCLMHPRI